jgi:hypothetical protein
MNLMTPPEIADGGYWSVQALDPSFDGQSPLIPDISFCAWYGSGACVVRTVSALGGVTNATVQSLFPNTQKPHGRLGGV